jgi:hypothetical protein
VVETLSHAVLFRVVRYGKLLRHFQLVTQFGHFYFCIRRCRRLITILVFVDISLKFFNLTTSDLFRIGYSYAYFVFFKNNVATYSFHCSMPLQGGGTTSAHTNPLQSWSNIFFFGKLFLICFTVLHTSQSVFRCMLECPIRRCYRSSLTHSDDS